PLFRDFLARIDRAIGELGHPLPIPTTNPLHRTAWSYAQRFLEYTSLRPVLETLTKDRDITAWVAYNDALALQCCDYLLHAGIGVPHRLSIIGFDDSLDAMGRDLTSYNFNLPAIAHLAVAWAAGCREKDVFGTDVQFEVEGAVVERATVRRST
ncbi:MAG: hypothetical protein GF331_22500, partial [Chitinivibrionales bacterium]|nr:hypothetical protein [Chitinivibrionales bacterium]